MLTERQKRINKARELAVQKAQGRKFTGKMDPALSMAYAYEEALSEYLYKPAMKYIKGGRLDPKLRSTEFFRQAARLATALKADFGNYVRAQFFWIHSWFGRACQIHELRGTRSKISSVDRYKRYMELLSEDKIPKKVTSTSVHLAVVDDQEVDKINDKRLKQLCELWDLDAEHALIAFVPEGIFDDDWLKRNVTYRKLKRTGRL